MEKENIFKWKHYQPDITVLEVTIHAHQAKFRFPMNFRLSSLYA